MPGAASRDSMRTPAETFAVVGVAFDGTRAAWHAVGYARGAARRAGADLEILRVTEPPDCAMRPERDGASDRRRSVLDELERAVASAAQAVDAQGVILYGDPVDELVRASFRLDLLVLGSRGNGPARGAQPGPVAARVKRLAACRVVVVAAPTRPGRRRAEEYGARARLVPDAQRTAAT